MKNLIEKVLIFSTIMFFTVQCYPEPAHVKAAHKVMNSFTRKMNKEGFNLYSSGGAMMGDIKQITLDYEICRYLNVEQARLLFIKKSKALLNEVNCSQEIRSYLHDYPFTFKNIFFKLSFCKEDGEFVDPPYIAFVFLKNEINQIQYCVFNKKTGDLDTVYKETYDEALRIYNETINQ